MAGTRSQRFARHEDSSVALDGDRLEAELLQRLEDQAAALAETKSRLAMLESAVDAERKVRRHLSDQLNVAQPAAAAGAQVAALKQELEQERTNSENLGLRLQEAWAEIQGLKEALHRPRRRLRRRADAGR